MANSRDETMAAITAPITMVIMGVSNAVSRCAVTRAAAS